MTSDFRITSSNSAQAACRTILLGTILIGLGGCSPSFYTSEATSDADGRNGEDGGADPPTTGIALDPSNQILFLDIATPETPATLTYQAFIGVEEVTADTAFSIEPASLGTFEGPQFTSTLELPGSARGVTALVKGLRYKQKGTAKLTLVQLRKTPDAEGRRDFFFIAPFEKDPTPEADILRFATNISKVDVAFVMDTTGSMSGQINNLKSSLTTTIIPGLSKIPSVGFAVVDFRDWEDDWTVLVRQVVTTDVTQTLDAVNDLSSAGGDDEAEAQLAAMHHVLTGEANGTISQHTPAPDTFGGVDFRPGAVPVVVLISDAPWHNPSGKATLSDVQAAFNAVHARFVSIYPEGMSSTLAELASLADATKSTLEPSAFSGTCGVDLCCTGVSGKGEPTTGPKGTCRLNFAARDDGSGVSDSVVSAVQAISVGSTYDIRSRLINDPKNGKGIDATSLIKTIRAMEEGSAVNECLPHEAYDSDDDGIKDTFKQVTVGTPICFEVIPQKNTTIMPQENTQFVNAFVQMVGEPGSVDLGDQRTILFLIPPHEPEID